MPLILGQERLIPGFEGHVLGLKPGESTEFDITFPADYGEAELAGQVAHFAVELKELREKVLPPVDDDFARSIGSFDDLANLRVEIKARLERNALDKARHEFSDKIIEYAVANADFELPGHPRRPGGRGDARRVPGVAGPPGDRRGGLSQGRREDRGRPPRRVPAELGEAGPGPPRPLEDRRGRGRRRSPTPRSRPRSPRPASATPATARP